MKAGDLVKFRNADDLGYAIITHINDDNDWARVMWNGRFEWIDLPSLEVVCAGR